MKKSLKKVSLMTLFISLLLSLFVLYTPTPQISGNQFSAIRAAEHIEVISREPHSVFDPVAHEEVRLYIKDTLTSYLGAANVFEYNYTKEELNEDTEYGISNVLGVLPGQSDTGIMLVGHYDSRGHIGRYGELGRSYGAADDGYALGTMLEMAYLLKDLNPVNSVYFLFTDAEETGLFGAKMMAQETSIMENVGFLINIEARGVSGPAYMFETSGNNDKVIQFYQESNLPVSYSLATAVYAVMPNYTDFTAFLAVDVQGINFAVLEGLNHYHTPLDNYLNINLSSLQHYGAQIEPLVRTFISDAKYSNPDYFVSQQNRVFFTLFAGLFISYTETAANIYHIITLVLFIALAVFLVLKKKLSFKQVGKSGLHFLTTLLSMGVIGYMYAQVMAFLGKTPFSLTYVRMDGSEIPTLLVMVGLLYGLYVLLNKKYQTKEQVQSLLVFGIAFNLLLALATGFTLAGASFLFFIPALLGVIALASSSLPNKVLRYVVYSLSLVVITLLVVPILYSFFLALTVGGTAILLVLLAIAATVALPIFVLEHRFIEA